jgi:Dr1-associated corepressor
MSQYTKTQPVIFPVKKIKNFIQRDQKIGKISSSTPIMISRLLEMLLIDILNEAACIMEKKKNNKLKKKFLKFVIIKKKIFKFS